MLNLYPATALRSWIAVSISVWYLQGFRCVRATFALVNPASLYYRTFPYKDICLTDTLFKIKKSQQGAGRDEHDPEGLDGWDLQALGCDIRIVTQSWEKRSCLAGWLIPQQLAVMGSFIHVPGSETENILRESHGARRRQNHSRFLGRLLCFSKSLGKMSQFSSSTGYSQPAFFLSGSHGFLTWSTHGMECLNRPAELPKAGSAPLMNI